MTDYYTINIIFLVMIILFMFIFLVFICILLISLLYNCFILVENSEENDDIELQEHQINIEDLSKHIVNIEHPIIPKNCCVICLGEFEENDTLCTLKYCEHTYHKHCIKKWIFEKPTCPLCQIYII